MDLRFACVLVIAGLCAPAPASAVPRIYTIAGAPEGRGSSRDGVPAIDARLEPSCVAGMPDGSVLVVDGARVRRIGRDGYITTFRRPGAAGARTPIRGVRCPVAALGDGGFVFNHAGVRRVAPDGEVTLVAGGAEGGSSGDEGPAVGAHLEGLRRMAALADGTVVVDDGNLRRVTTDGRISTLAGINGPCGRARGQSTTDARLAPFGLSSAPGGGFVFSDADGCVLEISPAGAMTAPAPGIDAWALRMLPDGGFLFTDGGELVRRRWPDGAVTVVAGCKGPACIAGDGPAVAVKLGWVHSVVVAPDSSFYLALDERIVRVDPTGSLTTVSPLARASSLALASDGSLLVADADSSPATGVPAHAVIRIAPDGSTAVVAGGGTGPPRPGLPATQAALTPWQVVALPDGFAVGDSSSHSQIVIGSDGTIRQVVNDNAERMAVLADGSLVAIYASPPCVARLRLTGMCILTSGPVAAVPGARATSVELEPGGFAPLRDGGWLLPASSGRLLRVDRNGRIDRVIPIGRSARLWLSLPLAPGPHGTALFAARERVVLVAADGTVTELTGGRRVTGFFGSFDGEPARGVDIDTRPIDVTTTPDGGVLIVGELSSRVLWVAPTRTRRLGLAITRSSLRLLHRHRIALRTTVAASVEIVAHQHGRIAGRRRVSVRRGESAVPLPGGLVAGEFTATVTARTRDRQQASTHHRFLFGDRLPMATARRVASAGEDCRRYTSVRIACVLTWEQETSLNGDLIPYCTIAGIVLAHDGVVYVRGWGESVADCTKRDESRLFTRTPDWRPGAEASPL